MAELEWQSLTIGQNKTIQDIVSTAAKASELLNANVAFVKTGITVAKVFLGGLLNPKLLLLNAIADEIDNFVADFKSAGFHILEVADPENYVVPTDAEGNPIKIVMSSVGVAAKQTAAIAAGQSLEFAAWAKEFLGEDDILLTGAQKAEYKVAVGKSKPAADRTTNANDNKLAEKDDITGLYKMTPSQVIATMTAAMDDELDLRRPQFSSSAEAGAIVFIVGMSDLTKNLANLKSILNAFVTFFGGADGVMTKGVANLGSLVESALGQAEDPTKNSVDLVVKNVAGVRGSLDDRDRLLKMQIPYNFSKQFEEGDFVAGPRAKVGMHAIGYVSAIVSTEPDAEDETYSTQTLTITGVDAYDAIAFRTLSSGAKLQKAAYAQKTQKYIDQNSGATQERGPYNDYKFIGDLSSTAAGPNQPSDAETASTKVVRNAGDTLLTVTSKENVLEYHSGAAAVGPPGGSGGEESLSFATKNTVCGDIFETKLAPAPPPNFKAAKLTDLIGDFKTFFASIDALTASIRKIAADTSTSLDAMIAYLDAKITELDEINEALQKILALFTIGLPSAGVYTLNIPVASGGNDYIKTALTSSANQPPDDLEFSMGFLLVGGGPTTEILQTLLTGGGGSAPEIQDVTAESVAEQILR